MQYLPMPEEERALDSAQRRVTAGILAEEERREVIRALFRAGMTQRELAERMSKASLAVGGPPVTENSVQKIIMRLRVKERV
jgi:transposase